MVTQNICFLRCCIALVICVGWMGADSKFCCAAKNVENKEQAKTAADESDVAAGHSYHGEAFDEGPRQSAYLMEGTGRVDFPVTTESDEVRSLVNQGVGQLHGFWYFEAERSFRQAASIDPDCAMLYWGMALANTKNAKRAKQFIAEAVKRKSGASDREKMYIDALDTYHKADPKKKKERAQKYLSALEDIVYEYPEDIEAKALVGLQIWLNKRQDIPVSSHLATDALLNDVLAHEPLHPCHHFRIHLWDYEKPEMALNSAALCGQSAPAIAHMWHMPGHIFSRLKRYSDAAWQQEASARVDHAHMIRDRLLPDQIHNFAHNNEWLISNLNHVGRVHDAISLARNMTELPRHPKYNTINKRGSYYYGRLRLIETLSRFEMWDELISLCETPMLAPTSKELEQVRRLRHLGAAHFRAGNSDEGHTQLALLQERLNDQKNKRDAAVKKAKSAAEKKGDDKDKISKAASAARKKFSASISRLERAINELDGYVAVEAGDYSEALELFDKASGVNKAWIAEVHLLAGDKKKAIEVARKNVESNENEVRPLAALVEILWKADRRKEAGAAFDQLLELSAPIDLDVPVFERIAPIAAEFGFEGDWRMKTPVADDVGDRPDLDSLGPFRWQPPVAPGWTLTDADGESRALSDYERRPVVVIFYLGFGCLHCAEQLQSFAPKVDEFEQAGLSLIAISTDKPDSLIQSQKNYDKGPFPFPLVSNSDFDVFKAWRCWDDFENQPLHGTFLIDADGRVRWQDISYEPFNDPDFVIEESQRLLGTPPVALAESTDG